MEVVVDEKLREVQAADQGRVVARRKLHTHVGCLVYIHRVSNRVIRLVEVAIVACAAGPQSARPRRRVKGLRTELVVGPGCRLSAESLVRAKHPVVALVHGGDAMDTIVLDEFYGGLEFVPLRVLCGFAQCSFQVKGGIAQVLAKTFVFTSTTEPSTWYEDPRGDWARRIAEFGTFVRY